MKRGLPILLFLLCSKLVLAQDPGFSQFYANPVYLNPAFTGTTEIPRVVLNYRNQWPQKGATYTTYGFSYDFLSKKTNSGIGFQVIHDKELNNVVNSNSATISYSYHLKLKKQNFVTLALQGGMVLKQFNTNSLIFPSQINQLNGEVSSINNLTFSDEKKMYPDFAVGVLGMHNKTFWGLAVHHLTSPNESLIEGDQKGNVPVKVTLHAGTRTKQLHYGLLSREFTFSPNIMYQQQGSFKQLNLGIYLIEKSVVFGGWFRNNMDVRPDAVIALIGFASGKMQFGYSFDFTLSKLANYSYGSHEVSVTFFIGKQSDVPIRNKLLIPMITG